MTQSATTQQAPEVAALSDDTRREIVDKRNSGVTLAELKREYPQLTSEQIREVLPPANARERRAREAKAKKDAQGSSQPAASSPTPETSNAAQKTISTGESPASTDDPKEPKTPRYVEDAELVNSLAERITAARAKGFGRAQLMTLLDMPGRNVIWMTERAGKVRPDEVDPLDKLLTRIEQGEVAAPERKAAGAGGSKPPRASRAELEAKLDAVARLLHDEWRDVRPASFRDSLADLVGAPKPEEAAK